MPVGITQAANIFNDQQEMDLGDAMAEHLQRNYRVSDDEKFVGYLRQIAGRLLSHMPENHLRLRLFLVDLPNANAFDSPGGRIYISLKLVALARNEDELAGILAHELGHMVVHQGAIDLSRDLKTVLDVTRVSDRRDIYDKYNRLIEGLWRKRNGLLQTRAKEMDEEQRIADRLALYAMAGAGYSTEAFANIFDRIAGTEGKTGNWLTDFFGATRPDSKRLREMIKAPEIIPEGCTERATKTNADNFRVWQAAVIENSDWANQELLHGILSKTKLNPPLRGGIRRLNFSPDGRFILAQDEGNIYVLTRQPFKNLFQISAPDSAAAQFTPDSQSVVFNNGSLRVEKWNIAIRKRTAVRELVVQKGCWQPDLSPDGRLLACLEGQTDLVLFDVATGAEVFRKPSFVRMITFDLSSFTSILEELGDLYLHPNLLYEGFSPDGSYYLASSRDSALLFDTKARQPVSMAGSLKKHIAGTFVFVGIQKLVVMNESDPAKSQVLSFPSGEVLADVTLGKNSMQTATLGDYLMLRPVEEYGVGVMALADGKHLFANKQAAMDIYGQEFVCEERDGELGIFNLQNLHQQLAQTALPGGDLGALKAHAISPDWKWLAASEEDRGGIWNIEDGARRFLIRGFRGAYFADDSLYADFPKYKEKDREIAKVWLVNRRVSDGFKIEENHVQQFGDIILVAKPKDKSGKNDLKEKVTWEIRDVRSGAELWSRNFPKEVPTLGVDSADKIILLGWDAATSAARDELKHFPAAQEALSSREEKRNDFFVELLEATTGKPLGAVAVDTGSSSLSLRDARASGDWVAISDSNNRVLLYSLSTGKEVQRFFGSHPALSVAGGLLCVENESGHLTLYDINTGQDLDRLVFSSPVLFRTFSNDGKRLFVLTADQTSYVLDVSSSAVKNVAATAPGNTPKN